MHRTGVLLVVASVLVPSTAWTQGDPVGTEFRVNTFTPGNENGSSVATDSSGGFVVVWHGGATPADLDVFGQRYNGSGVPTGPEFRVNTYTTGVQHRPAIATDSSGGFVVVWQSPQDGSGDGIFGQRYASTGAPLGPEFQLNTYTTATQARPAIAADGLGNFVVVWQGGSTLQYDVFGQRYASSGAPLGPEFRVNTDTFGTQEKPAIASDPSGRFLVTWEVNLTWGIWGQRFASSGAPNGAQFPVILACLPCSAVGSSVASDSAGNFVVVWTSNYPYGGSNNWIAARRYASSGTELGFPFRVNTYATNYQTDPAVAADASGNFVVVWASEGQDGSFGGIFGQRFANTGAQLGPEFRVNTYTSQGQNEPAVAANATGNFVVTWSSNTQDGSGYGVFGQRYNMIVPVELMHFRVE